MIDLTMLDNIEGKRFKTNAGRVVTVEAKLEDPDTKEPYFRFRFPSGAPCFYTKDGKIYHPPFGPDEDLLDGKPL